MSELLPTRLASQITHGLTDYLATTFALSDSGAQRAVNEFLTSGDSGMFKGPFIRLRLPYEPSTIDPRSSLDYLPEGFVPYGHQAAAFTRLTSQSPNGGFRRPQPTIVTTGTGSGKTEAFLYPILDHVLRAQAAGISGIKALILYPMNALANDQAHRLAELLSSDARLSSVRAGIYTGEEGPESSRVTPTSLITDRYAMRADPPDILLTNYKMLDMLLLREEDSALWEDSATSLQYLILDEFHTYDGAQGTDVAMLLRRLGALLKSYWPSDLSQLPYPPTEEDRERPLGRITPVGTSATLGSGDGGEAMLHFAHTVFGEQLEASALVTESRMSFDSWRALSPESEAGTPLSPDVIHGRIPEILKHVHEPPVDELPELLTRELYETPPANLLAGVRHHPLVEQLARITVNAVHIRDIASELFPDRGGTISHAEVTEFVEILVAYLSSIRAQSGREALGVETHLWVRELSRIDAAVDVGHVYRWSDDGVADDDTALYLPAVYCRHCGKSGWGAITTAIDDEIGTAPSKIREEAARRSSSFRALMHAAGEADAALNEGQNSRSIRETNLRFFHTVDRKLTTNLPDSNDRDFQEGRIIPVLTHTGPTAGDQSTDQACPACFAPDAIRFVGSAIATLTSVAISNMFGNAELDPGEKKALVFTDSVQDAAHRAGFIQSRAHTFALRSQIRRTFTEGEVKTLAQVSDDALGLARFGDADEKYAIIPPELVERPGFREFWTTGADARAVANARNRVLKRFQFDAALELGLQSRLGRTLELTGSLVAEVDMPPTLILDIANELWDSLGILDVARPTDQQFLAWVRGLLIRMRIQGGIFHPWLGRYIRSHGRRYHLWGGRYRNEGMPAFPAGRPAPAFPIVGATPSDSGLDPVGPRSSWYADWTSRVLSIPKDDGGRLASALLPALAENDLLKKCETETSATVYALDPHSIFLSVPTDQGLAGRDNSLHCTVCQTKLFGTLNTVKQLDGSPCLQLRCPGIHVRSEASPDNYYRQMYATAGKRVVSREHTSLLPDDVRRSYEDAFRAEYQKPDDPNVLVATPTLEMGIDIGDLSCVMLASMPRTVANYVQRVGRAGRKTGNSLVLSFVRGRGEHLPKLYDPLSIINGEVAPPSTYLEAEEILTRQFTAFVGDTYARAAEYRQPRSAIGALQWKGDRDYLPQLAALVERSGGQLLDTFINQFGPHLSVETSNRLRSWAHNELPVRLEQASADFQRDLEDLRHRRTDMDKAILTLQKEYEDTVSVYPEDSPEVKKAESDLKSARAQASRIGGRLAGMRKVFWISALEAYGVFPNYTLVGDSVDLDLTVISRDEDTQEFKATPHEYSRGASSAIQELAPGSTFYVQGMEIAIDAVDLGPDLRDAEYWQVCPSCGWRHSVTLLSASPLTYGGLATRCIRCGAGGINDAGNVYDVIILSKVSAEVRRDEASISDSTDDRKRVRFEIAPIADINDAYVEGPWQVDATGFGSEYLRSVDITWLNLGRQGVGGKSYEIAGKKITAPLFPLCEYCGKLDPTARHNSRDNHRFWCKYRNVTEEHTRPLVLARKLSTQGVKLTLPPQASAAGQFSVPTLHAAILLGLKERLGGTPGHLQIISVPDPKQPASQCFLVHDTVPGGTGYLASFKDPEVIFDVLATAWRICRDCPCQLDDRRACHRCVVPYAPNQQEDNVSRLEALRVLGLLLGVDEDHPDPDPARWNVRFGTVEPSRGESPLEIRFREALKDRLKASKAQVEATPTIVGEKLVFTLKGKRWKLDPQVAIEGTRPDFVLSSEDTNIPKIAIYTDGFEFHATPAHNRVGDDAIKRENLRAKGIIPWAVTLQDIERFASKKSSQDWKAAAGVEERMLDLLMQKLGLDSKLVTAIGTGTMGLLWEWMLNPSLDRWRILAKRLPASFFNSGALPPALEPTALAPGLDQATATLLQSFLLTKEADRRVWGFTTPHLVFRSSSARDGTRNRTVLHLEDGAVGDEDFRAAWQQWLLWSTLLAFTEAPDELHAVTTSTADFLLPALDEAEPEESPTDAEFSQEWADLISDAYDDEKPLLTALAESGAPLPEVGEELAGLSTVVSWPDRHIAVLYPEDIGTLDAPEWTVLSLDDIDGVVAAVCRKDS